MSLNTNHSAWYSLNPYFLEGEEQGATALERTQKSWTYSKESNRFRFGVKQGVCLWIARQETGVTTIKGNESSEQHSQVNE